MHSLRPGNWAPPGGCALISSLFGGSAAALNIDNEAVARAVKPGEAIRFEFVERKPGEWVVTKMERRR